MDIDIIDCTENNNNEIKFNTDNFNNNFYQEEKIINAFMEIIIHHLYLKKLKSPHMNYLYVKQDSRMIYQN